jgi:S-formylglutathione hydrolase FrmB
MLSLKRRLGTSLAALSLLITLQAAAPAPGRASDGGRLEVRMVEGKSLENSMGAATERRVSVYLPPSYATSPDRAYPTLYILHGIMDSDQTWTRPWDTSPVGYATIQEVMDQGVRAGLISEIIIVIPDSDKACHYTNSPLRGNWEDFLRNDLVTFIDTEYRTLARASSRGIAGHSMGGHGAIKLAMKYPETFSALYALNPSLLAWGADVEAGNPAFADIETIESFEDLGNANFYVQALVGVGHCFSPNPSAPFMTDLPYTVTDGKVVQAPVGFERWSQQMPLYMIDSYLENLQALRGIRFDTALEDEYSHIPPTTKAFSDALTARGIEHHFEMYNGDHRNRLWGRDGRLYTELLPYFSAVLDRNP